MLRPVRSLLVVLAMAPLVAGCYAMRGSDGGGLAEFSPPRAIEPADVALPEGYRIEAVAGNLTFPTGVTFDDRGGVYVTEAGYAYGEVFRTPRLVRVEPDGHLATVIEGEEGGGPWTGALWHDGAVFIVEGGVGRGGGRALRARPGGTIEVLVDDLPSYGDHHANGPVLGPDGWLYFAIGTATNSGVVGPDNADFGWLQRHPELHDIPCQDVRLTGADFRSHDPLAQAARSMVATGPFLPFGTPASMDQVVPGRLPCNGAIFRLAPAGGAIELVAWGLRNPFGLAFAPDGALYATDNAYDNRGSRPVFGAGDLLWRVERGAWHGWPDFHGAAPLADQRYRPPGEDAPTPVLAEHPNRPPSPAAVFAVHSSSNGLDFSHDPIFGHVGQAFVAQFGDMAPEVGKVWAPVGYRVVRVDVESGVITSFAENRAGRGPASYLGGGGLERPVAVRFDPAGRALYVVDFGVMTMGEEGPEPRPQTGVLWRIVPTTGAPIAAAGGGGGAP